MKPKQSRKLWNDEPVATIASDLGVSRSTVYTWIKSLKKADSQDKTEISLRYVHGLERKITRLQEIIEILQAVDCTAHSPLKEKLEALEALYGKYNVHVFCEALQIPRGTFYNHIFRNKRQNNSYRKRRDELRIQVQRVYDESRQIYGAEKIASVLKQGGIYTSKEMVWN